MKRAEQLIVVPTILLERCLAVIAGAGSFQMSQEVGIELETLLANRGRGICSLYAAHDGDCAI